MNIFGIGLPELAVIAAIGLLVFGPKRLPELGKTLGRTLRGFQSASQEFEQEFRSAIGTDATASPTPAEPSAQLAAASEPAASLASAAVADAVVVSADSADASGAGGEAPAGAEVGSGPA